MVGIKFIKKNKKTVIANILVMSTVCFLGHLVISGFGLHEFSYIGVGLLAGAIELDIT